MSRLITQALPYRPMARVSKYRSQEDYLQGKCYEQLSTEGNDVMDDGAYLLLSMFTGNGGTSFGATNSYLAAGDSDDAGSKQLRDLIGVSLRRPMDAGYPLVGSRKATYQSTFGRSEALWYWRELGLLNAAKSGLLFCRALIDWGTKRQDEIWVVQYEINIL